MLADSPYPELKKTHTMARTGRPYTDYKPPVAAPVWDVIDGFGRFHTLCAALELRVLEDIQTNGPSTGDEVAERLGLSAPHTTTLLEGVVACGFLERVLGVFRLNDTARRYLLVDGPASMVDLVPVSPGPLDNWRHLAETVRTGVPPAPVEDDPDDFYVPLVEATFTTISRCAMRADLQLRYSALTAPRVLDLGAGGAPWTAAILSAVPDATAVVNDLPGVIDVARTRLAERDVDDRVEFRTGDFLAIDVEPGTFDVVVLGHVCRAAGDDDTQTLIDRAATALKPGGRILIGDYFCDRSRSLAAHSLMMGVTMMASTRVGRTFTADEVGDWLTAAGFEAVRIIEPIGFQQVIVGTRTHEEVAP
ncbi:MAG: methyltransferase [Actinomycetota bacterium]